MSKVLFATRIFALGVIVLLAITIFTFSVLAAPLYAPGETLDPTCAPTNVDCTVTPPAISGANSDITSLSGLTTPLSPTQGGLGMGTYVTGDIVYASAANTLARLAAGTNGQVLTLAGGVPTWATPGSGSGVLTLNGLTGTSQLFAVGSTGTDFAISSSGSTHTFNLPSASASVRGALLAADWSTFNAKEPAITAGTTSQYWRGDKTFQTLNTSAVSEGSNLYFTDTRSRTAAQNGTSAQLFYVAKDVGSDANDCSIQKPCLTIQAGINAANAVAAFYKQAIVQVQPSNGGTGYTENITFSQQGVHVNCVNPVHRTDACVLTGTVTVNLTGTTGGANFIAASNLVYLKGFVIISGSGTGIDFTGSTFQRMWISNVFIQALSNGIAIKVNNTGVSGVKSTITATDVTLNSSGTGNPTVSILNGRLFVNGGSGSVIENSNIAGHAVDQSGATSFNCNLCEITGQVNVTDNTATAALSLSSISSSANSCIATPASPNTGYVLIGQLACNSSNTNSVTGSGVLVLAGGATLTGTSGDVVATVTQSVLPSLPQGELQLGAGAVRGTNVLLSLKGGHMKFTQTTAPTAVVNANAGTSATCTLSNGTDVGGIINLTEGSGAWASGTQCTVTFNKSYGVAPVCVFTANNAATASKAVSQQVNITTSTTTLVVSFGVADSAATAYKWMYHCLETQ